MDRSFVLQGLEIKVCQAKTDGVCWGSKTGQGVEGEMRCLRG